MDEAVEYFESFFVRNLIWEEAKEGWTQLRLEDDLLSFQVH